MKAKLISHDALQSDWEIPLDDFPVVIGRSGEAEIQLAHPQVSDLHCVIDEVNGQLQVRDLESERGTFVNDKRIEVVPLSGRRRLPFLPALERQAVRSGDLNERS